MAQKGFNTGESSKKRPYHQTVIKDLGWWINQISMRPDHKLAEDWISYSVALAENLQKTKIEKEFAEEVSEQISGLSKKLINLDLRSTNSTLRYSYNFLIKLLGKIDVGSCVWSSD